MSWLAKIDEIRANALQDIRELTPSSDPSLIEALRVKYLGRKGELTHILRSLPTLDQNLRPQVGREANTLRIEIETKISEIAKNVEESIQQTKLTTEKIDITLPGRRESLGSLHPTTLVIEKIVEIFTKMGFDVESGPEAESEYYNFEALNVPANHPARDMQDTFYLNEETVLRTHTSPVQIRTMEKKKPPLRFLAPGTVYRHDYDVSHTPMFHQIEGLYVDEGVSLAHLKGVLTHFLHSFFNKDVKLRFRPSFFPFTEPSAEVDITCIMCAGKGCRVCKQTGWLEVLGCGMVHENVFKTVGYDTKKYTGFAFGLGIERLAMLKYGIDDLRMFFENDLRFLKQFKV